jgi:long-chain fatty acid transport protein
MKSGRTLDFGLWTLGSLLVCLGTPAYAGGLEVGEQNAVSASTGGAGTGRDGDPGAAWHDPAALADDGGWRVGVSLTAAHPSLEARGADGTWSTANDAKWSTPPHIDASFANGRWAAGVALGVPFGGGVAWPSMWPASTEAVKTELVDLRAAPFFAWRFGKLRVAAGLHLDAARLQIARNLDFIDTQGNVRLDLAGRGMGADASVYYRVSPALGVGLVYRGATTIHFDGNANFTAPDAFSEKTPDQTAETTMTLPDQVVLGAAWQRGAVLAVADVAYARWSVNDRTTVRFANPSTPEAVQDNHWHDTFTMRAGAEWQRGKLALRGGGYYDPSPVPAEHLTPASPDATRVAVTAGASYRLAAAWTADVFGEQMFLLRRDTTSTDTMPASYGGTAIVLGAGLRWIAR